MKSYKKVNATREAKKINPQTLILALWGYL